MDRRGETPAFLPLVVECASNAGRDLVRENVRRNLESAIQDLKYEPAHSRTLHIVGSGPSVNLLSLNNLPFGEDVMALNGAYGWLMDNHIAPDYFAMLDAREVNKNFLRRVSPFTRHLFASQTHPDVVRMADFDHTALFHLYTDDTVDLTTRAPFWIGSGVTVGLVSLGLAVALGYRKLVLHGFDSSYAKDASHAFPQAQNSGQDTISVYLGDREYRTTGAMAAQVNSFVPLVQRLKREVPGLEVGVTGEGLLQDWVAAHSVMDPREAELAKYRIMYAGPDYGMQDHLQKTITEVLSTAKGTSYLDVGCGRGEALDIARRSFDLVQGTETVPALIASRADVAHGVLPNLPFNDNAFDVVGCWEVIEHLVPEDVIPALHELVRVARNEVYLSAAIGPHIVGGMELHPSARPEAAWDALLKAQGFRFDKLGVTQINSPIYRIHKE